MLWTTSRILKNYFTECRYNIRGNMSFLKVTRSLPCSFTRGLATFSNLKNHEQSVCKIFRQHVPKNILKHFGGEQFLQVRGRLLNITLLGEEAGVKLLVRPMETYYYCVPLEVTYLNHKVTHVRGMFPQMMNNVDADPKNPCLTYVVGSVVNSFLTDAQKYY